MSMTDLADAAGAGTVSARRAPSQKEMAIRALRRSGRAVGFIAEGIYQAPAL